MAFFSVPSDDLPKMMLRGGVRHVPVLGSIMPGTSGIPGSGSLLQGGAMACTVVLELMSGKLTCCIASRWYSQPQYSWKPWAGGMIAQMVLAELAGGVAEVQQELGEAGRPRLQVRRTAGQLRRNHAGAQRIHAGDKGTTSRGATLHGEVVHEDRAFVCDAVNVGCFPDHQAAVIATRLHPADVVAHNDEDIGFLFLRLQWSACADERSRSCQNGQTVTEYFLFVLHFSSWGC